MNICHLAFRPDSLTYTAARALVSAGHDVCVWVVDPDYQRRPAAKIRNRLVAMPRVRILPRKVDELPGSIDRLIIQVFPRPPECLQDVDVLAPRARRITLISAGDRSKAWGAAMRLQWIEARKLAPYAGKIDRVAYKDGFHPFDLHGLFKSRRVTGFDVHSQFLHSDEAYRAIHARNWAPESSRPILVNFLGSQDPASRKRILDDLRPLFIASPAAASIASNSERMYWHEYTDASAEGVPPMEFLDILTRSDFTLCPHGYSLVTHRPIEALLRGSIPVLSASERDLYDIGLEDEVNCIAVPGGRWRETVTRLAQVEKSKLIEMRRNVFAMLDARLDYEACAERMRARLGLVPSIEGMPSPSTGAKRPA